ncbi:MAG: hypothetical protein AAB877_00085 [Patescibacteria group bacterium]
MELREVLSPSQLKAIEEYREDWKKDNPDKSLSSPREWRQKKRNRDWLWRKKIYKYF